MVISDASQPLRNQIWPSGFGWWPGHPGDFYASSQFPPNTEYHLRVFRKGQYGTIYLDNFFTNEGPPGTVNAIPFDSINSPAVGTIAKGIIPTGILFGVRVGGLNYTELMQDLSGGIENNEQFVRFIYSNNWMLDLKFYGHQF